MQTDLTFPQSLAEKYRPGRIADDSARHSLHFNTHRALQAFTGSRFITSKHRDKDTTSPVRSGHSPSSHLGVGGLGHRTSGLRLPDFSQLFAAREDVSFRFIEALEDACAFDSVAGTATSHKIAGIFFSLARARNHEIDAHYQRIFKTCAPVQPTIATDIIIAIENLAALFNCYRGIHQ